MNQQPADQGSLGYRTQATIARSDCRLVDDAIEEFALGIASESQCAVIERHLLVCERCAALVMSFQQTAAALALSVPIATPPGKTKSSLMARIAETPQAATSPAPVFAGNIDSFRTPTLPTSELSTPPNSTSTQAPNSWWRVYAAPLATLPLILALGLVAGWGFNNYAKLNDANGVIAMQDRTINDISGQLDLDDQQVVNLAFSPSSKRYTMTSDGPSQSGRSWGTLLADPVTGQAALQVEGLATGSYSVLVQTQDGAMVRKAEFFVGSDGTASTAVDLGNQISNFQSIHIRANNSPDADVAVEGEIQDVLMAVIGPNITQDSDTSLGG